MIEKCARRGVDSFKAKLFEEQETGCLLVMFFGVISLLFAVEMAIFEPFGGARDKRNVDDKGSRACYEDWGVLYPGGGVMSCN